MRKIKVLFVYPPFPVNHRHKVVIPISLCRIAAYLVHKVPDVQLSVFDAHIQEVSIEDILAHIEAYTPDVVAVGYWTCQAPFVYELSKRIRTLSRSIMVVHGGIHASFSWEEALQYCDAAVIGEGERTFSQLIQAIRENRGFETVKGLAFKRDGQVVKTPPQPLIENLDDIPFPAFELFDIKKYIESGRLRQLHVVGGKRMPVLASRGCPYDCHFCLSPTMWGKNVRWRSPNNVLDEIRKLHNLFGFTNFQFYDDNFLLNKSFVVELCKGIPSLGFDIKWVALSRAKDVIESRDILKTLKDAGCVGIEMGIETSDKKVLEKINKQQEIDWVDRAVKLQKNAGLSPLYTLMVFSPGETISSIRNIRAYIEEKIPESISYNHFGAAPFITLGQFSTPYPGTCFYKERLKEGMILVDDWSDMFHHQLNFLPHTFLEDVPSVKKPLSEETIEQCVKTAEISLFKYFPGDEKVEDENRREMKDIAVKFHSLSNGKKSIREIAEQISRERRIDRTKVLRFVAAAIIVLAQKGIITGNGG
jgi:radical SAM superfamily enzyme YgiQ (UPF0313 family)